MTSHDPRITLIKILNAILEREYNSLLKYLLDCDPYIPAEHDPWVREIVERIAAEDARHAEDIADIIDEMEATPQIGHYTVDIVDLSYLSIEHSFRKAVAWKDRVIGLYDEAIAAFEKHPETAAQLSAMKQQEANHRDQLSKAVERLRLPKAETPAE